MRRRTRARVAPRIAGMTLVELLIGMAIFGVVIAALSSLVITAARGYEAANQTTQSFQDSEAALQILRYDIQLAGYKGVGTDYKKSFSTADQDTLLVTAGADSDEVEVRYFEDPTYLETGDDGQRSIRFYVDTENETLMRDENGTARDMVGNVSTLRVEAYIISNQERIDVRDGEGNLNDAPSNVAALELNVTFTNGSEWRFATGLASPQSVSVSGG